MTLRQLDKMTKAEMKAFEEKHTVFDENQSYEEYKITIRDIIYLWRYTDPCRKSYTFDSVNERVNVDEACIKSFYEDKEPAAYAAIDIDYACG